MKKLLLSAFTLILLVGCGEKVILTPEEEKTKLVKLVYAKEEKAIKEYNEIKLKLTEQVKKGSKDAMAELEKWESVDEDARIRKMNSASEESIKYAEKMRKLRW